MAPEREKVRITTVGTDRLANLFGALILQHCRALSAAGSGRRRFGPLDKEPDSLYIRSATDPATLQSALALETQIAVVLGHGGWFTNSEWKLGTNPGKPMGTVQELFRGVTEPSPIPASVLIVNACRSQSASSSWKQLLRPGSVLITTPGEPGSYNFARWVTVFFDYLSCIPGKSHLTAQMYLDAAIGAEELLRLIDLKSGNRQRSVEYIAELV